jgi:hypothetical protein
MYAQALPKLTALEAESAANGYLLDNLPDKFLAIEPRYDSARKSWRLPVVIAYPFIGPIGEVGEIYVSSSSEDIVSATPLDEMKTRARTLYEQNREAIEAAFHRARNT